MKNKCDEIKAQFNRIRGQFNGIAKMIEADDDATKIAQQISAVRAALSTLAVEILKEESKDCFDNKNKEDNLKKFEELVSTFFKMT
jgi:DNA-binding FrmR family transcriptional regulator